MKHLELELSKTRFKNAQSWTFALFCTTVSINFPLIRTAEYWGLLTTILFYSFVLASNVIFMGYALYYSYKIKKLEDVTEKRLRN